MWNMDGSTYDGGMMSVVMEGLGTEAFAVRDIPVMGGIRERIAGLRSRAETAP